MTVAVRVTSVCSTCEAYRFSSIFSTYGATRRKNWSMCSGEHIVRSLSRTLEHTRSQALRISVPCTSARTFSMKASLCSGSSLISSELNICSTRWKYPSISSRFNASCSSSAIAPTNLSQSHGLVHFFTKGLGVLFQRQSEQHGILVGATGAG
eukprot:m.458948 g.458948  ORF g.458948 m.458948 type:complete len:153 (-) comp21635_c0_seq1:84-542(-)